MPRVLVIGDIIDDVLVRPHFPIRPDTDTESSIEILPGGSGANFAAWLATHQIEVSVLGRVAAADFERHAKSLAALGVKPLLQQDRVLPTGAIVVLVEGEQRSFLTQRGANSNLDLTQAGELLADYDLVYLSGYSVFGNSNPESAAAVIQSARRMAVPVACDPGSAGFISDFTPNRFLKLTEGVDYLFPSLEEGRVLTGEDRPELIADALANRYENVILTLGASGAVLKNRNEFLNQSAFAAEVLDPTGAGDAFAAGFIASLLRGEGHARALEFAARQGAKAVTISGGRPRTSR